MSTAALAAVMLLPVCALIWLMKALMCPAAALAFPRCAACAAAASFAFSELATPALVTSWVVRLARLDGLTVTSKVTDAVALLPAASVAIAVYECVPTPNEYAGPTMLAHVLTTI